MSLGLSYFGGGVESTMFSCFGGGGESTIFI